MLSGRERRLLVLLVISGFLNYVDRANLSVGLTDIQTEMHLSPYQLGVLQSGFFWTYAAFQLFAFSGWLVDRFNVYWVLAAGFFLWSGATAITGMAHAFAVMFALRLLLGMGESVAYPAYSRILANNFPEHHRGLANALIDAGTKAGPALGTLLGGLLIADFGWRPFFLALGLASLIWLGPWVACMPRSAAAGREDKEEMPSTAAVLRQRPVWFTAIGLFCSNYFWYFLITWLPYYLERERHFPKQKMAVYGSLSFLAVALSSTFSGWLSDHWIGLGGSPTRVRKTFAGLGLTFSTVILPVALVRDSALAMAFLMLACVAFGVYASNVHAISQTMAGPRAAGKWTSFQNGFANLAGVAAPWFTGWVVQTTGQFYLAFLVSTVVVLAGAGCFVFGVQRVERVKFA